ncbi:MAG: hypothetical protein V4813_13260 [Gemmatimonadota bacterium]
MSLANEKSNRQYVARLAASVAAHPAVGSAATRVLQSFSVSSARISYTPRVSKTFVEPARWPGTDLEDALAAFAMLEARAILKPPVSGDQMGLWQKRFDSVAERAQPFTPAQWTTLFERYWTLLREYMPPYGRTVSFSARLLTQLMALSEDGANREVLTRRAFDRWTAARQLTQRLALDGTVVYTDNQRHYVASLHAAGSHAQWMRAALCREADTIVITNDRTDLQARDGGRRALHLSAEEVRHAVAYDAARGYGQDEALVAQRLPDGTGQITLAALLDARLNRQFVDTITSITVRLATEPLDDFLHNIGNVAVQAAATEEIRHVLETLEDVVERCQDHPATSGAGLSAAQQSLQHLREMTQRVRSQQTLEEGRGSSTGVGWSRGIASMSALPGIRGGLTRADLMDVVPPSAWAYPHVRVRVHPLYSLLTPAGVRAAALALAVHRYHACPTTRADARIALQYSSGLQGIINASFSAH